MAGVKGKSGRKKAVSTLVNEALERVDENLPDIFTALIERALRGDRQAQIYLIDRRLGMPKQQLEADLKGGEQLGVGVVTKLMQVLAESRREFLEGGGNAVQIKGTGQDMAQAQDEETESHSEAK